MEGNAPVRSTFVTVVAWIFIIMSGFATLIGLLQNIMVQVMFSGSAFDQALNATPQDGMPAALLFVAGHVRLIFFLTLMLFATMLTAAIGLLRRLDWARLLFIGMMALGIAWNLGGFALQIAIVRSFPVTLPDAGEVAANFAVFQMVILVFSGLIALGLSALFGWIVHKLLSPAIAAEFDAGQ